MSRSISFISTLRLIRSAVARGVEEPVLWSMLRNEPRENVSRLVPVATHIAIWAQVMRVLDDSAFPIDHSRTRTIDDLGILGIAAKTAETIGDALGVIEKYFFVYSDALSVRLLHLQATEVVLDPAGSQDLGQRCWVESKLASLHTFVQQLGAEPLTPLAVTFTHHRPRSIDVHEHHFGIAPRFSATRNAIVFAPDVLRRPVVRTDPTLHFHFLGELAMAHAARSNTWSARTRAEILRRLPKPIEIVSVARGIGTSSRTLQRRLSAEGIRFDEIADSVRYELARALLADPSRTIAEVAFACGFAEPSSFSRAYRRWTGSPPRTHRS